MTVESESVAGRQSERNRWHCLPDSRRGTPRDWNLAPDPVGAVDLDWCKDLSGRRRDIGPEARKDTESALGSDWELDSDLAWV